MYHSAIRLLFVAGLCLLAAAEEPAPTPMLAVVATKAELFEQPAIEIDQRNFDPNAKADAKSKFHLGLEATEAPAGTALLLYCGCEDFSETWLRKGNTDPADCLGPLSVRVQQVGGPRAAESKCSWERKAREGQQLAGKLLYCSAAGLPKPGRYKVTVSFAEKTLAEAEITATDAIFHYWSPMEDLAGEESGGDDPASRSYLTKARYDGKGRVYPAWEGIECRQVDGAAFPQLLPLLRAAESELTDDERTRCQALIKQLGDGEFGKRSEAETALLELGERLHALLGMEALESKDPEIRTRAQRILNRIAQGRDFGVTLSNGKLAVRLQSEVMLTDFVERSMARWWINGKPYLPAEKTEFSVRARGERVVYGRSLTIDLEANYKAMGAKSGDVITLQILYCPFGFSCGMHMLRASDGSDHSFGPVVSNRVSWKVP